MTLFTSIDPLFSLSGFFVGLLVGQTGVGGGSLMTPILVLLFGIHPATAVGTDLLYASATKTVGTLVHGLNHTVDWRIVRRLASGSVPATVVTLVVISHFAITGPMSGRIISMVLGVMLLLYPRVPMKVIVGSDIAHAVPLTLVAGVGHWWLGSVDWPLLTSLLSGSIPGIILGSYLSARIPDAVLRPILAAVLCIVGGRLVL
jgi:uncharacterized protein